MIGALVNNHELLSPLGSGGMGQVFLARHRVLGRQVAVKVLRSELAGNPEVVRRFIVEAQAASAIRHPGIVEVTDVGLLPDGGPPYMMMELLEGETLAARLRRAGRLPLDEALTIARQVAAALGAAHAAGIVHRDLKPENLFLLGGAQPPRVKVLDFGIAKLLDPPEGFGPATRTGILLGTPAYMSPEQCQGLPAAIDQRSDIYALGIILYEMLCGSPPFDAEGTGAMLVQQMSHPPVPPRQRVVEIPPVVEAAIMRALEKRQEDRFGSMEEFTAALEGRTAPIPRRRARAWMGGLAAAAAVLGGGLALWKSQPHEPDEGGERATRNERPVEPVTVAAPAPARPLPTQPVDADVRPVEPSAPAQRHRARAVSTHRRLSPPQKW